MALYLVATPIGNLADITLRAKEVLEQVETIICEDTRVTGQLLKLLNIIGSKKYIVLNDFNEVGMIDKIVNTLQSGSDVVLVSDAGTPLISDPGYKIIRECIKQEIKVISVPGACAGITALISSGLPPDKFLFLGYPPEKQGRRLTYFKNLKNLLKQTNTCHMTPTVIMYESPHRLVKMLIDFNEIFGNIEITVARELTKLHEEVVTQKVMDLIKKYQKSSPRGELVVLFHF